MRARSVVERIGVADPQSQRTLLRQVNQPAEPLPVRLDLDERGLNAPHRLGCLRRQGDGLVTRTVTPTVPVRVDYELTPLGRTLLPIMLGIKDWAETDMDEVNAARKRYDKASRSHRG